MLCMVSGKRVILDTDIGGDPDDAFALLFALNSPELTLDLVVTNDENEGNRARFAKEWMMMMQCWYVPVVAGVDLGNTRYCLTNNLVELPQAQVQINYLDWIAETVEEKAEEGDINQ